MEFVMCAVLISTQSDSVSEWASLTVKIEQAYLNEDVPALRSHRAELLRMLAGNPPANQAPLVRYAIAYVDWRMVFLPSVADNEKDGLLDEAEAQLQSAIKANANFAEAHALLGSVWGGKIAQSALRGILLGPRIGSTMGRAQSLEPNNPRVVVQDGIGAYHTPGMFGGGVDKAERIIRQAIALFDKEPVDKAWPNWGRFDAHVWLAQILVKKGNFVEARAEYQRALALSPKSGWITYMLLPELEKAAKGKP